jgi:hypothetical protein
MMRGSDEELLETYLVHLYHRHPRDHRPLVGVAGDLGGRKMSGQRLFPGLQREWGPDSLVAS